jgi:hypothetical protein
MQRPKLHRIQQTRCDNCGRNIASYDVVSYGSVEHGYRELCGRCFNSGVAESDGLAGFEHIDFEPVEIADCTGELHVFHFRTRLFGPGVALDAFELRDGYPAGYQFQLIGDPDDDLMELFGRLIEKIRRGLSIQHLGNDSPDLQIADHRVVRGRIDCDLAGDRRVPLLVIDGREITWQEFGRMLMTYEGWQFKLAIADKSEEL